MMAMGTGIAIFWSVDRPEWGLEAGDVVSIGEVELVLVDTDPVVEGAELPIA
jgi:hypothetical protein